MKKAKNMGTSLSELKDELLALLREQFNFRMQKGAGSAVKPHLIKNVRRNIARVKTRMHQIAATN